MRRIIERVVTVVTTTTWTISWKDDPLPTEPEADTAPSADASPEAVQSTPLTPPVIEIEEADRTEETATDSPADVPPIKSHSSKIERK